VFLGIK